MLFHAIIPQELTILFGLLLFVGVPTIALIDILRSTFNGNDKLIWVIVVIFMNLIGVLLYVTIGKKQKTGQK